MNIRTPQRLFLPVIALAILFGILAGLEAAEAADRGAGGAREKNGTGLRDSVLPQAPQQPLGERAALAALAVATHLYFFAVGATIGSFLNVVVYRLPRSEDVIFPSSRCPRCGSRIRARDNIPIVSWLVLRGRCRDCGVPISPRYLLVELATGLMFWGLLAVEVVSGGANLPLRQPEHYQGVIWTVWALEWDLLAVYGWHCFLLCVLLCIVLIRADRQPVPRGLRLVPLLIGLSLPMIWPWLRPVPAIVSTLDTLAERDWSWGLMDGLMGLTGGALVGMALCPLAARRSLYDWSALVTLMSLVGVFLGWQAAISIAVIGTVMALAAAGAARARSGLFSPGDERLPPTAEPTAGAADGAGLDKSGELTAGQSSSSTARSSIRAAPVVSRIPPVAWPAAAVLVQLPLWRALGGWPAWPGPLTPAPLMVAWLAAVFGGAWSAGRLLGRGRTEIDEEPDERSRPLVPHEPSAGRPADRQAAESTLSPDETDQACDAQPLEVQEERANNRQTTNNGEPASDHTQGSESGAAREE